MGTRIEAPTLKRVRVATKVVTLVEKVSLRYDMTMKAVHDRDRPCPRYALNVLHVTVTFALFPITC